MKAHIDNPGVAQREPSGAHNPVARSAEEAQRRSAHPSDSFNALNNSPRALAQRRQIRAAFGPAAQLASDKEEDEPLQGKLEVARRDSTTVPDVADADAAPASGMPGHLREGIESLSGLDMSDVRVHANSDKPARLNALAYAQGNDIHLGPGQEQHLPHEAWHVVQQRQGRVQETTQMAGIGVNNDHELEREADVMGHKATQRVAASDSLDRFNHRAHWPGQSAQMKAPVQRLTGLEAELHVPVFKGGGATHDAKIRKFLRGGIVERKLLEPAAGGFKKVTDHDVIGDGIDGVRILVNGLLNAAGQPNIKAPGAHKVAIMEYVTDLGGGPPAYDETTHAGRAALRLSVANIVADMNIVLANAKAGANPLPNAYKANTQYGVPDVATWTGFAVANGLNVGTVIAYRNMIVNAINDNLGMQLSVGIRPEGIRGFLRRVGGDNTLTGNFTANSVPGGGNPAPWIALLTTEAARIGGEIVQHITTGAMVHHWFGPPTPQRAPRNIRNSQALKGFVSLIVAMVFGRFLNYRRGQAGQAPLTKNALAYLPRTPVTNVLRELDVAVRPDRWPAGQLASLQAEIVARVAARLNAAPVNRIPADDANVGLGVSWQNWVNSVVSNPAAGDLFFNGLGGITQVDPHDHPDSAVINPVVGAVVPADDHPRPYKNAKGVDKAKSGAVVGELRYIQDIQPAGLLALVNNVIGKVRASN